MAVGCVAASGSARAVDYDVTTDAALGFYLTGTDTLTVTATGALRRDGTGPVIGGALLPRTVVLGMGSANTVSNAGTIEWTGAFPSSSPLTVQDLATAVSFGATTAGTVVNTGVITSGANTLILDHDNDPATSAFTSAAVSGSGAAGSGFALTVRNSGDGVASGIILGASGINAGGDALITGAGGNGDPLTGRIQGVNATAIFVGNWAGLEGRPQGRLLGNLVNAGTITSGATGASIGDLNGFELRNRGLIEGTGAGTVWQPDGISYALSTSLGIAIGAGTGRIVNEVGGIIRGTTANASQASAGILLQNYSAYSSGPADLAFTIENSGQISGKTYGIYSERPGPVSVENAGDITGGTGVYLTGDGALTGVGGGIHSGVIRGNAAFGAGLLISGRLTENLNNAGTIASEGHTSGGNFFNQPAISLGDLNGKTINNTGYIGPSNPQWINDGIVSLLKGRAPIIIRRGDGEIVNGSAGRIQTIWNNYNPLADSSTIVTNKGLIGSLEVYYFQLGTEDFVRGRSTFDIRNSGTIQGLNVDKAFISGEGGPGTPFTGTIDRGGNIWTLMNGFTNHGVFGNSITTTATSGFGAIRIQILGDSAAVENEIRNEAFMGSIELNGYRNGIVTNVSGATFGGPRADSQRFAGLVVLNGNQPAPLLGTLQIRNSGIIMGRFSGIYLSRKPDDYGNPFQFSMTGAEAGAPLQGDIVGLERWGLVLRRESGQPADFGRLATDLVTNANILGRWEAAILESTNGKSITNGGQIRGGIDGLRIDSAGTVINQSGGLIEGDATINYDFRGETYAIAASDGSGIGLNLTNTGSASSVQNVGTIRGATGLFIGAGSVDNLAGGIIANTTSSGFGIQGGSGGVSVINAGTITGQVSFGSGSDLLQVTDAGTVSGIVTGGSGTDTLRFAALMQDMTASVTLSGGFGGIEIVEKTGARTLTANTAVSAVTTFNLNDGKLINTSSIGLSGAMNMSAGTTALGTMLDNRGTVTVTSGGIIGNSGMQRIENAFGATISGNINLNAGDDYVSNRGAITGSIDLGDGNDSYVWWITGVPTATPTGPVNGGDGTDSLLWGVDAGQNVTLTSLGNNPGSNPKPVVSNVEGVGKAGEGTLTLDFSIDSPDNIQGLQVQGGTLILAGGRNVSIVTGAVAGGGAVAVSGPGTSLDNRSTLTAAAAMSLSGENTLLLNAAAASVTVMGGSGTIQGVGGSQSIDNAGTINAAVALGDGTDNYILRASGTQTGTVAGDGGTSDYLQVETGAAAIRSLTQSSFTGFETVQLNLDAGSTGKIFLAAAVNPAIQATLDTGGAVGTSVTLNRGDLVLNDTAASAKASLRAETVTVAAGASLSGNGTVFNGVDAAVTGTTAVAGTLSPGLSVGQLSFNGNLFLAGTSLVSFELGQANVPGGTFNDLIDVSGNLTLDGNLTVAESAGGTFGPGVYRLINYGGTLTNNVLDISGGLPNGLTGVIQTAIANQVNLVVAGASGDIGHWDGPNLTPGNVPGGRGGTSVWNATRTNWTTASGDFNDVWDSVVGVFGGLTGTVTVEGTQAFNGMQFVTDHYLLVTGTAGALDLGSGAFIHVDSNLDATIDVGIEGAGALSKQGGGELDLMAASSFAGGVLLQAGMLGVGDNAALGTGALAMADTTTLKAMADNLSLGNTVSLTGTGTVNTQSYTLSLTNTVSDSGPLVKTGTGQLNLMAANGFNGGLQLNQGTLGVGNNAALGTGSLAMADATMLKAMAAGLTLGNTVSLTGTGTVNTQSYTLSLTNTVSGSGPLVKTGAGQLNLMAANGFNGGVQLNQGTLGAGNNAALGTGSLTMADATTLRAMAAGLTLGNAISVTGLGTVDTGSYTLTLDDTVSGTGALNKDGTGTLILKDNSSLAGWDIRAGTLDNRAALVASGAMAMSGAETWLLNAAGASVTVAGGAGTILGAAGSQSIDNAGAISAGVSLDAGADSYILRASGAQTGKTDGGADTDYLQIETGSGATRTIAAAAFTGFETVELNLDAGSAGTVRLAAAGDPAAQATLDTGGGAGTSVTLNQGELNLEAATSSLRARQMTITRWALLSGVGQIFNGPDGLTSNAGWISPGNSSGVVPVSGMAALGQINVTGNVTQTGDGVLLADFKPDSKAANRASDVLVLTGNANLSGTVVANQWTGTVVNASQSFVLLESTGGVVTDNGLTLELANSAIAPGFTYGLSVADANKLVLSFRMTPKLREEVMPVKPSLAAVTAVANSVQSFAVDLIGCPHRDGVYASIEEDECVWADIGGGYLRSNPSGDLGDVDQTTWWLAGGGQAAVTENIRLGMAGRYENISEDVGDNAHSDGVVGHWGAMASYNAGPLLLASGLSVGRGWMDSRRDITLDGFHATAEADTSISYVNGKIRGGYLIDFEQWYLKPLVDLDASRLWYGGGTENIDNGSALSIGSRTDNLFSVSPRMEVGGQWETENGLLFRPMLQLGATFYGDSQFSLASQFIDAPGETDVFVTKTEMDKVTFDVSAAVDVFNAEGNSLQFYYDGSFGDITYSHEGGLRLRIGF